MKTSREKRLIDEDDEEETPTVIDEVEEEEAQEDAKEELAQQIEQEPDDAALKQVEDELKVEEAELVAFTSVADTRSDGLPSQRRELDLYMAQFQGYPQFTPGEASDAEYERLFIRYEQGDAAVRLRVRDRLIYGNSWFVLFVVRKYSYRGLPQVDLMQEGMAALMRTVERYRRGGAARFSTYAYYWIRHALTLALSHGRENLPYRIPTYQQASMDVVRFALVQLAQKLERTPSAYEVYEFLRQQPPLKEGRPQRTRSLEVVRRALRLIHVTAHTARLDAPMLFGDGGEGSELIEVLNVGPPKTETVLDARRLIAVHRQVLDRILQELETFPPKWSYILRCRLGIGGEKKATLQTIGDHYGITRERTR